MVKKNIKSTNKGELLRAYTMLMKFYNQQTMELNQISEAIPLLAETVDKITGQTLEERWK